MDARGSWWDRLALNLDSHLKQKDEALKVINAALEDISLGDKDRLLLQVLCNEYLIFSLFRFKNFELKHSMFII